VLGIERARFERALAGILHQEAELDEPALEGLISAYKAVVQEQTGAAFPSDVREQLQQAIRAVFESWQSKRARVYRATEREKGKDVPEDLGTAVTVVAMVFGNMGPDSGAGTYFTRNSSTGEPAADGEFLPNAQGEDVVSGRFRTQPLAQMAEMMPEAYQRLLEIGGRLEGEYQNMMDIEFTVERGRLYILQVRSGARTSQAAIKIAVDQANEGLISRERAILRVSPAEVLQILYPRIDPAADVEAQVLRDVAGGIVQGTGKSLGVASGRVVLTWPSAVERANRGERVILVRTDMSPDDIKGLDASEGIVTKHGGDTSHFMLVAKGRGRPAIAGIGGALEIDEAGGTVRVGGTTLREGDVLTVDANENRLLLGEVRTVPGETTPALRELLSWADEVRTMGVRVNADTPQEAAFGREYGAEGIGLVRTEHMFFGEARLPAMQDMILAATPEARREALDRLQRFQEGDFEAILRAMDGLPVTIRLLDPPLHEFLPKEEELLKELRATQSMPLRASLERTLDAVRALKEVNPMLGFRGARVGIVYPEITRMQVRAIFRAAARLAKAGLRPVPEVMVPLIFSAEEFEHQKRVILDAAHEVLAQEGLTPESVPVTVGTMIELPGAALDADRIARLADFFSFGTNDLTQTTLGVSRDDAQQGFLQPYLEAGILPTNPFVTLHPTVLKLMEMAVAEGRRAVAQLKIGICGVHAGDPDSIAAAQRMGLGYVSPSSGGVLAARLAAAQAQLRHPRPRSGPPPGSAASAPGTAASPPDIVLGDPGTLPGGGTGQPGGFGSGQGPGGTAEQRAIVEVEDAVQAADTRVQRWVVVHSSLLEAADAPTALRQIREQLNQRLAGGAHGVYVALAVDETTSMEEAEQVAAALREAIPAASGGAETWPAFDRTVPADVDPGKLLAWIELGGESSRVASVVGPREWARGVRGALANPASAETVIVNRPGDEEITFATPALSVAFKTAAHSARLDAKALELWGLVQGVDELPSSRPVSAQILEADDRQRWFEYRRTIRQAVEKA
jgi:pyruvate,orthophosphate dikinase